MSGVWQVWKTKQGWYASKWFGESPESAGPFQTREDAMKWVRGEK